LDTAVPFDLPAIASGGAIADTAWRAMASYDYSTYFSQANLVAASISI